MQPFESKVKIYLEQSKYRFPKEIFVFVLIYGYEVLLFQMDFVNKCSWDYLVRDSYMHQCNVILMGFFCLKFSY
ncbi:hypothetical protein AtEden1_Chr4g0285431 [Arabidopsis thaliana]